MRLAVPPASFRELYLVARYGPDRVGRKGKAIARFLSRLGLNGFSGGEEEFVESFLSSLDKLRVTEILGEASKLGFLNHMVLAEVAGRYGLNLSASSARNLLKLLRELGLVTRLRSWLVYTPSLERAALAVLYSRGEAKVSELEKLLGGRVRESLLKLWAEGLVEIEGCPRSPLKGKLDLPRDLAKHGLEYDEELIASMGLQGHPRLEKFVERETGRVKYAILLRGDDRVRIVVPPG
ncbi:MAG: hypothetical protein QXW40_08575 [Thermofilum sp.]